MTVSLLPKEGRAAKELGQRQKLSQRELRQFQTHSSIPTENLHKFGEQRLGGFHQITPASLKLK
jgi:hypothetical protein